MYPSTLRRATPLITAALVYVAILTVAFGLLAGVAAVVAGAVLFVVEQGRTK